MKEKLTNNLALKLIAAITAVLLWLLIMNNNDPVTTFTVTGIPVELVNAEVLEQNSLVYEVVGSKTVSVSVTTRTKDKRKITSKDFKATADLANIYDVTSNVEVKVELVGEDASLVRNWLQIDYGVSIATEEIVTRLFKIEVVQEGQVEDGYDYRQCTLSSEMVALTGAVSKLNDVSAVKAFVDVSESAESETMTVPLEFYNASGREIRSLNDMGIQAEMREVEVDVVVQKTSPVSLDVVVNNKEKVAAGYRYITYRISQQSISVIGTMQSIAGLDKIQIEIDAEGASGELTRQIDIQEYLPDNVTVAGGNTLITVSLVVEPEGTVELEVPSRNISFEGQEGPWAYYIHQPLITVSVFGLESDWEKLTGEDIYLIANVSGMGVGDHILTLSAVPIEGLEITVPGEVNLSVVDHEAEDETGESDSVIGTEDESPDETKEESVGGADAEESTEEAAQVGGTEAEETKESAGAGSRARGR
ncbi:MAG: hypothetical protein IJZ85_06685 [Lachnospiraceae bacterium]|nr:hypothetical protein [Lachnospiraceae bacterium]